MKVKQVFFTYHPETAQSASGYKYCPLCGAVCSSRADGGRERPVCTRCSFVYYHNPAPAVAILIIENEKILLGKRVAGSFQGGKWCLPGGFIEFDEDFLTAARREVREETGLIVTITSIVSVMSNYFHQDLHTLVVVLLAEAAGGELQPGDDIAEASWFPLAGPLPEMAFAADEHIIIRYHQTKAAGAPVEE